ncbi:HD-GYP domain-containing protein [uncultured Ruminococcus sp.]|uniref:HD-GYP domain-containing protein n=1 Tax=uncultured Ruminococcus sp. TaxID=165186 RepID=UPI00260FB4D3|nr:HD-GYP domain-containing protein [uncultured Ruminococcus sp.]
MGTEKINYEHWQKIIEKAIIGMSICQFCVEVVVNTLLFLTEQQGYNQNTIVGKLIRYQLMTTLFNLVVMTICFFSCHKIKSDEKKKYILTLSMSLICLNISFSHYQFAPTFLTFTMPLIFTIMYEDKKMCRNVTALNIALLMIAVIARGTDSEYNVNIVPETIITVAILLIQALFSTFVIDILYTRRNELNDALVQAEKAKYIDELNLKNQELERLSQETFEAIAKAVDANDPYTAGHSKRVARYAQELAFRLGFSAQEADEIYHAGLIHDVGKLGIDNGIINKNGKLTDEEYAEIKRHPSVGYEILKGISIKGKFAQGAKCHHERIDGKGYPNHLNDSEIPYLAKIIAVADAYDAMTSKRPYRDVLPQEVVREQIESGKGTQFDSEIAEIMLVMIDEDVDYQMKQQSTV